MEEGREGEGFKCLMQMADVGGDCGRGRARFSDVAYGCSRHMCHTRVTSGSRKGHRTSESQSWLSPTFNMRI